MHQPQMGHYVLLTENGLDNKSFASILIVCTVSSLYTNAIKFIVIFKTLEVSKDALKINQSDVTQKRR